MRFAFAIVVSLLAASARAQSESEPVLLAQATKLDLNTASFLDLFGLPDVSPVEAKAIVSYREKNGPFRSVADVSKVPGVSAGAAGSLAKNVFVAGGAAPVPTQVAVAVAPVPTSVRTPRPPRKVLTPRAEVVSTQAPPAPVVLPDGSVDLNRAGVDELMTLPRMTEVAARELVAWREANGPFRTPHDIVKVPLFGEAAYQRLKTKLVVAQ